MHHHEPPLEISKQKRYFLFGMACTHVLLASGEAYGWTALRPVLLDSGLFDAYSETTTLTRSALMNTVATMGIAGNALCKLPLGILLDKFGPRATAVTGAIMVMVGSLLLGLCDKNNTVLPVLGYLILGMAGPFLQMPCFQFSELFAHKKASAMAYLITFFELSTGVFWVFGELHYQYGLDMKTLFIGYSFVGLYCLVTALAFWPDMPYRSAPPIPQAQSRVGLAAAQKPAPVVAPLLMGKPLLEQIMSVQFGYLVCFLSMHIFRQGFLLGTIGPQVEAFFPDPVQAEGLKGLFNVILPLGFIPMMFCTASGFAGFILSRPRLAFIVVTLLSMVYGLLLMVHNEPTFIALFVVFPVARQFVFSTFFSFAANTFGYASFGRIAGVASTFAGLLQLSQTFLVGLVEDKFFHPEGDAAANWSTVDLVLGTVPMFLFIYPIISWVLEMQKIAREKDDLDGAAEMEEDEDFDTNAPLMGRHDHGDRDYAGARGGMAMAGGRGSEEDEAGAPMMMSMSYSEAMSYGSQSSSSFAALYSKYVTEDVKVVVRPVTPDSSIHISSLGNE